MKRLVNWLLGYGVVRVEGAFPERLLNLCAQAHLPFWALCWQEEGGFVFSVRLRDLRRLEALGQRAMCRVTAEKRLGVPAALLRWRRRLGFLAGMALAVLAVAVLSRFVLVVEVTGCERVPAAVILSELQRLGVHPGVYGPGLDRTALANEALRSLPELSFLSINRRGTRLEVVVREAEPAPELLAEDVPADVVAAADGIILDIHTAAGQALFADGDTVAAGEVLISGDVELRKPEGSGYDMGKLVVHAAGSVRARTWRTMEASIPLSALTKTYTGAETTGYSLKVLWETIDFFGNSGISYAKYDKITKTRYLTIFGCQLPLALTTTTWREYAPGEGRIDAAAARAMLESELRERLEKLLAAHEGTLLRLDFTAREAEGVFTVTMLAECEEEIARTVERAGETGRIYGENPSEEG